MFGLWNGNVRIWHIARMKIFSTSALLYFKANITTYSLKFHFQELFFLYIYFYSWSQNKSNIIMFLRRKQTLRTKKKVKPLRHLHRRAEFFATKLAPKVRQVHLRFWTEGVESLYGMYVQGHRVFCKNNQFLFIL